MGETIIYVSVEDAESQFVASGPLRLLRDLLNVVWNGRLSAFREWAGAEWAGREDAWEEAGDEG